MSDFDDASTSRTWWWERAWGDFRRGSEPLTLSWEGGRAHALLYDQGVPATVAAVRSHLPMVVPVVHVAWSGEMCMGTASYELGVTDLENQVRLVRPGDLTWDPKYGELGFVYGTAECRLPTGPNSVVVYGGIIDSLPTFAEFGRARRFEGVGKVTLSMDGGG